MMLKSSIEKLMRGEHLKPLDCEHALTEMFKPEANPMQIAAFLVLLHARQETAEELSGIIHTMRKKMIPITTSTPVLDIVGTGGDRLNTVNISTGSAMLAASCGVKVAKHGNRSVSSLSGSADVLEALGINIQQTPEQVGKSIDEINIGFCYAPNFHPMLQDLRKFRRELNVPTTFNILGPLLNPAHASHLLLGVYNEAMLPVMAEVLLQSGCGKSFVVHGSGMDEISCAGTAKIIEIRDGKKIAKTLDPLQYGLPKCTIADLQGGDAAMNAAILQDAFKGEKSAVANTLILNAGVALYLYGLTSSIEEGISQASENLYNGSVLTLLTNWIELSHAQ